MDAFCRCSLQSVNKISLQNVLLNQFGHSNKFSCSNIQLAFLSHKAKKTVRSSRITWRKLRNRSSFLFARQYSSFQVMSEATVILRSFFWEIPSLQTRDCRKHSDNFTTCEKRMKTAFSGVNFVSQFQSKAGESRLLRARAIPYQTKAPTFFHCAQSSSISHSQGASFLCQYLPKAS